MDIPLTHTDSKKALILGVSGQDGAYLARLLLSKGYTVFGGTRDAETNSFRNLDRLGIRDKVQTVSISLMDFRSVIQTLHRVAPDEIYNLSGQSSVGLSFNQPVETFESISVATLNLLEAIRFFNPKIRFYNAGSSECFGNTPLPADETTPMQPRSPYAVAKSAAFWHVANYREGYGLHCASGILFNHESPLRPARFVTQKVVMAARRIAQGSREMLELGDLSIVRDWGWASEYVDAMWRILQHPEPEDFVIATGQSCSLESFVCEIFQQVGLDWRQFVTFNDSFSRPTDLQNSLGNPEKAQRLLGWKARSSGSDIARKLLAEELEE